MKNAKLAKRKPQKARAKRSAKSHDFQLLSPEALQTREDESENLLRLERMLTRAEGFALAFARVNVPTQRAELVKEIRRRVERQGIEIIEIDLQAPAHDFLNELLRRLAKVYLTKLKSEPRQFAVADSAPRYAVFVYGLEHSLPSSETYHPTLAVINYKRENFRQHLAAPLVIWVPEYALQSIIEGAPDFWAWRSGVFEFVAPRKEVSKTWQTIEPERGQIELSNMTLEEKRKRIHLLSGLLAEYEAGENTDTSEIMAIRFDLLDRLGKLYYFLGEYQHALEFHQRALDIAERSNYQAGAALSLHHIGMIHQACGDYAAALVEYEKSLKISEELGDRARLASSLHQISMIHEVRGNYGAALAGYEKALKIFEELSDRPGVASSLHQIGMIHHHRGDYAAALAEYEKALKIAEEFGDRAGVAISLHQIGSIHQERGDYVAALAEYEKSLKIAEELGNRAGVASSLHEIGTIHLDRGDYAAALIEYEKSRKIAEELGDRAGVAISLHQIGMIHHDRGDYTAALAEYEKALKIAEELGDRAGMASSLHQIGMIHQDCGAYAIAFTNYEKSLKTSEELGDRVGVAITRGQTGKLFTQTGRYHEAFEHLFFAHSTFVELQSPDTKIVANMLKKLRAKWGTKSFDAAWQKATNEAVPEWLKA
jgi:tetratricopeptide (TPR) repeat protein